MRGILVLGVDVFFVNGWNNIHVCREGEEARYSLSMAWIALGSPRLLYIGNDYNCNIACFDCDRRMNMKCDGTSMAS